MAHGDTTRVDWAVDYVDGYTGGTRTEWFGSQEHAQAWADKGGWDRKTAILRVEARSRVLDF